VAERAVERGECARQRRPKRENSRVRTIETIRHVTSGK
jgi:hypothetical protein